VINEVYAPNLTYSSQFLEFYNTGAQTVDLSTYYLYNSGGAVRLDSVPPTPLIGPGQYLAIGAAVFPSATIGSGLHPVADFLALVQSTGTQETVIDVVNWGVPDPNWPNYARFQPYFWVGAPPTMPTDLRLDLQRYPSGRDTDTPADWVAVPASPSGPPPTYTPTASPTPCVAFSDVAPADYFYGPVQDLACRGVVSGYGDGTFRPYANTTRAQLAKIAVLAFAVPAATPTAGAYTFHDVPPADPFFAVVETAAAHGIVAGYGCGPGIGPCDAQARPYFLPGAAVTRGQLSKITVRAAGWAPLTPPAARFADVPPADPFFAVVETAACYGVVSGYACGGPGEGCDAQARPYFRPGAPATRGQIAKIVARAAAGPPLACPVGGDDRR